MNSITELLNLEDSDIFISNISIEGTTKTLTLETKLYSHYCPSCGYRMYARGVKKRTIKHPILQDNYELILVLKQRRWMCTNPECKYNISDSFKFVNKGRRTTKATDMLIVYAYRDLMETAVSVADSFHVIQWIIRMIDNYIRQLLKKFRQRDRELEEIYIPFNSRNAGKPIEARNELEELISMYQSSEHEIFRDFGNLLEKYKDYIINSFIIVENTGMERFMAADFPMVQLNPSTEKQRI